MSNDSRIVKCDKCGKVFAARYDEMGSEIEQIEIGDQEFQTAPKLVYIIKCPNPRCGNTISF